MSKKEKADNALVGPSDNATEEPSDGVLMARALAALREAEQRRSELEVEKLAAQETLRELSERSAYGEMASVNRRLAVIEQDLAANRAEVLKRQCEWLQVVDAVQLMPEENAALSIVGDVNELIRAQEQVAQKALEEARRLHSEAQGRLLTIRGKRQENRDRQVQIERELHALLEKLSSRGQPIAP
jgi:hypothetical protein